jgi:hypothetical protein
MRYPVWGILSDQALDVSGGGKMYQIGRFENANQKSE